MRMDTYIDRVIRMHNLHYVRTYIDYVICKSNKIVSLLQQWECIAYVLYIYVLHILCVKSWFLCSGVPHWPRRDRNCIWITQGLLDVYRAVSLYLRMMPSITGENGEVGIQDWGTGFASDLRQPALWYAGQDLWARPTWSQKGMKLLTRGGQTWRSQIEL